MAFQTLFHIGSISKAFCVSALGILMDDFEHRRNVTPLPSTLTEINWHTPVQDLLPGEWQLMDEWASRKANLKDILSHVSGLPDHDFSYGIYDSPKDLVSRLRYLRPAFELREQWSYNNQMYMVAGYIIETYSRQNYTSFVEDRIFTPLGMSSSTFSPAKATETGKFTQGWTSDGRLLPEWFTEDTAMLIAGAGGVISSTTDMSKWVSLWLNKGMHDNLPLLPPTVYGNASQSYAVMVTPDSGHSIRGYGMGWARISYLGHNVVYHSGQVPGCNTMVLLLPDDDVGVIIFANGGEEKSMGNIANRITRAALRLQSESSPLIIPEKEIVSPPRDITSLELALERFSGTYTNPGYGRFTLCSPASSFSDCDKVISDFTIVDRAQPSAPSSPQLFAVWPRIWSSHIRAIHYSGNKFLLYFTSLFPEGYGRDSTPFEAAEIMERQTTAEFVIEDGEVVGFGMFGVVDQLTERERKYTAVKDRADVWFDKM